MRTLWRGSSLWSALNLQAPAIVVLGWTSGSFGLAAVTGLGSDVCCSGRDFGVGSGPGGACPRTAPGRNSAIAVSIPNAIQTAGFRTVIVAPLPFVSSCWLLNL